MDHLEQNAEALFVGNALISSNLSSAFYFLHFVIEITIFKYYCCLIFLILYAYSTENLLKLTLFVQSPKYLKKKWECCSCFDRESRTSTQWFSPTLSRSSISWKFWRTAALTLAWWWVQGSYKIWRISILASTVFNWKYGSTWNPFCYLVLTLRKRPERSY